MSPARDQARDARLNEPLLPGDDQAVLLAEALKAPAGHVLHPVEALSR
jgi:hypothetical protein